jgi:hypothetical protein
MGCLGINSEGVEAVTRDDGVEYEYTRYYIRCSELRLIGHSFYRRNFLRELRHFPRKMPPPGTTYRKA